MPTQLRRRRSFRKVRSIAAFLRLTRPIFLLGGVVLYALGGQIARYEGIEIDSEVAHGAMSVIEEQVTNGVAIRMAVLYAAVTPVRERS